MRRRPFQWKIRNGELQLGERTLIMGVLNVTPDSFSDGGKFQDPDRAYAHAVEMEDQGADIIDVGAESTRPGSQRVSEDEELRRLIPVLKRLRRRINVPLCVDTYKSAVAERALEYDVRILNDPSGLTFDPELARVAAKYNAGLILNHMRGAPEIWAKLPPARDVMGTIVAELRATVHRAGRAGVERERVVIDPGLGFGKRKEQNAEILARLHEIMALDLPVLIGPSRKSFLARGSEMETSYANAAAVTAGVLAGAHIVRVHEVAQMRIAADLADAVLAAAPPPAEPEPPRKREPRTADVYEPPREPLRPPGEASREPTRPKHDGPREGRREPVREGRGPGAPRR
ncbi:MAG: dihydropteroate synthase [Acidobacteria bacterium]|nr:dihydropteroate synthase [Acidobacteriota bacterium]